MNLVDGQKSGKKDMWQRNKTEFSMSFICGVSNKRILGLMGVKETTTSEIIVIYLKNMLEELRSTNNNYNFQWVIIWDNATIHSGSKLYKIIKTKSHYNSCLSACIESDRKAYKFH